MSASHLGHPLAIISVVLFVIGLILVILEDVIHLRKSVPMMLIASLMWMFLAIVMGHETVEVHGEHLSVVHVAMGRYLLEYGELFFFLFSAMAFVGACEDRGVFACLKVWLVSHHLSRRQIFWITGSMAFVLSTFANNLTSALVLGAVTLSVAGFARHNAEGDEEAKNPCQDPLNHDKDEVRFVVLSCINIVVGSNGSPLCLTR